MTQRQRQAVDSALAEVLADVDAAGELDWRVPADPTVVRAHQHATTVARPTAGGVSGQSSYTGGTVE